MNKFQQIWVRIQHFFNEIHFEIVSIYKNNIVDVSIVPIQ